MSYDFLKHLFKKNVYDDYLYHHDVDIRTKSQLLVTAVTNASRDYRVEHVLRLMLRDFHEINLGVLLYTASCISSLLSTERVVRMLLEVDAEPKRESLFAAIRGMKGFSTPGTIKMLCESGTRVENDMIRCAGNGNAAYLVEKTVIVTFLIEMMM